MPQIFSIWNQPTHWASKIELTSPGPDKSTFVSSARSSYIDNVLLYIYADKATFWDFHSYTIRATTVAKNHYHMINVTHSNLEQLMQCTQVVYMSRQVLQMYLAEKALC